MDGYYEHDSTHRLTRHLTVISFLNGVSRAAGRSFSYLTGLGSTVLDEAVAHHFGASLYEILSSVGLQRFRESEARELRRLLAQTPPRVLILGEGALTDPSVRAAVTEKSHLLLLEQSWDEVRRIFLDDRRQEVSATLLAEASVIPGSDEERLEALYKVRRSEYAAAELVVDAVGVRADSLVRTMMTLLEERSVLSSA